MALGGSSEFYLSWSFSLSNFNIFPLDNMHIFHLYFFAVANYALIHFSVSFQDFLIICICVQVTRCGLGSSNRKDEVIVWCVGILDDMTIISGDSR